MKYDNIYERSYHPKWGDEGKEYFLPNNVDKLIVGTMPPHRLCVNEYGFPLLLSEKEKKIHKFDIDFYYGSKDNMFWKIFLYLSNNDISVNKDNIYEEIKKESFNFLDKTDCISNFKRILEDNNIGMIDIVSSCIHNTNKYGEHLASDYDLLSIKINKDFLKIIRDYDIKELYCTSDNVLQLLLACYASNYTYNISNDKEKSLGICFDCGDSLYKKVRVYVLKSPSRRSFYGAKYRNKYLDNYIKLFRK